MGGACATSSPSPRTRSATDTESRRTRGKTARRWCSSCTAGDAERRRDRVARRQQGVERGKVAPRQLLSAEVEFTARPFARYRFERGGQCGAVRRNECAIAACGKRRDSSFGQHGAKGLGRRPHVAARAAASRRARHEALCMARVCQKTIVQPAERRCQRQAAGPLSSCARGEHRRLVTWV